MPRGLHASAEQAEASVENTIGLYAEVLARPEISEFYQNAAERARNAGYIDVADSLQAIFSGSAVDAYSKSHNGDKPYPVLAKAIDTIAFTVIDGRERQMRLDSNPEIVDYNNLAGPAEDVDLEKSAIDPLLIVLGQLEYSGEVPDMPGKAVFGRRKSARMEVKLTDIPAEMQIVATGSRQKSSGEEVILLAPRIDFIVRKTHIEEPELQL